ncbi:MAG: flagellin, partial [Rhodospirillaceae bacterium]|nr:flagellin [Rhodospirillaceae bacterium]
MAQEITLSTATRSNLLSLQNTTNLIGKTQERLATGLKVNSAIDDALAFFRARNLNSRASDLQSIKDAINGGISVITAATQGLESIESVLKQMKALAQSAISAPESSTRAKLASQFNELRSQVDNLAEDSSFNGVNLLKTGIGAFQAGADSLTVKFNERTDNAAINQLVVSGLKVADFTTIMA